MKGRRAVNKREKQPGKFILVEGISGSGKTTLAKSLIAALKRRGIHALLEAEPTKSDFGKYIRQLIEGRKFTEHQLAHFEECIAWVHRCVEFDKQASGKPMGILAKRCMAALKKIPREIRDGTTLGEFEIQLLFIADRLLHIVHIIEPALRRGKWIVLDRYDLSTYAYGAAHGLSMEKLYACHKAMLGKHYLVPDITFSVVAAPKTAMSRLGSSGKPIDRFEKLANLKRVADQYGYAIELRRSEDRAHVESIDGSASPGQVLREALRLLDRYREHWEQ